MRLIWHSLMFLVLTSGMSAPGRAETIQIRIDKMEYSPAEVKAKVGDTVEWINADILAHTATVKGDWEVMIPSKKIGSTIMKNAGVADYYCRFHPNMKGRVVVSD
jgi:plastocyanin